MTSSVENAVSGAHTGSSRLSPEKIRAYTFTRAALGRRGISEEDVDQFLGRMAEEVTAWAAENAALRTENDRLKSALRQWQSEQATKRAGVNWKSRKPNGPGAGGEQSGRLPSETVHFADQVRREAEAILNRANAGADADQVEPVRPFEVVLREAQRLAELESERVARSYRESAGDQYTAEFEELGRRLAWATTFMTSLEEVETQLRAARETLAHQVEEMSRLGRR